MELTIENSWWNEGGLWQDSDLNRVKNSPLSYRPIVFSPEECQEASIYTLRGPRRVGKTISLKLLISELIEKKGWEPKSIVWTSLDTIRNLEQMESHLLKIVQYQPKLLVIDEVTAVVGWQRVIKKLRDSGIFLQTCMILTGSSAYDLKAGAERMAGRRGVAQNPDRILLPMTFEIFCKQCQNLPLLQSEFMKMYLKVGGFPFRVESFIKKQSTWTDFEDYQVFDDVLFYEFTRRKLDRNIALEVVGRLSSVLTTSVSYEGFIKPLSIAKDTARKYLDALGDSFLLATFSSFDTGRGRVAPKKDRKFGWIDPALGYLAAWLRQGEIAQEPVRAEWVVGTKLLSCFEARLWEGLSSPRNVFTWKSSSGNEIDYLVIDKSRKFILPVEVKYQGSISDWDFQVMERAFHKGFLVTLDKNLERKKSAALSLDQFLLKKFIPEN